MLYLIWFLLIGLAAGWICAQIMGAGNAGILGMLVVGIVGSFLGGFLIRLLGFSKSGGTVPELITAVIGAVVLVFLIRRFG